MIKRIKKFFGLNEIYAFSLGEVYLSLIMAEKGDVIFVPSETKIDGKDIPPDVEIRVIGY